MGHTTQMCQATDTLISSVEFLLTISFRTLAVVASWVWLTWMLKLLL